MNQAKEVEIVLEATLDAISRARRVLVVISTVIALGYYFLFHWYLSWDLARIDARNALVAVIENHQQLRVPITGSERADSIISTQMAHESATLSTRWSDRSVGLPIVGIQVGSADFSVAIMLIAVTSLLWLLFNQRRITWCLRRLDQLEGWGLPLRVLEFHFVLIGSHSTAVMRFAARGLLWGLPSLALAFTVSDSIDLLEIYNDPLRGYAFTSPIFARRVLSRLFVDFVLVVAIGVLGLLCHRAFTETEEELVPFAIDPDAVESEPDPEPEIPEAMG